MAPWRTYGREKEMAELERWCDNPIGFMAGAVMGRRGVGKTQLLQDMQARLRGRTPMVIFELPVRPDPEGRRDAADVLREQIDEAVADPEIAALLADLPRREPHDNELVVQTSRIMRMTRHCLLKGAIVGIDEFHNARPLGLESGVKLMIDRAGSNDGRWPGKLVVARSHQQQLIDMVGDPRAPLYQRFMHKFHLRALKADEVTAWICCAWPGFGARIRGTGAQGRVFEPFFDRDRAGPASASCAAVLIVQVWLRVPKNLYNDDNSFPESLLASTPTRPVVVMTRNAPPHRIGPANRNHRHGRKPPDQRITSW